MKKIALTIAVASTLSVAQADDITLGIGKTWNRVEGDRFDEAVYLDEDGEFKRYTDKSLDGSDITAGYIWDVGKQGGFHLGLKGKYSDLGTLDREVWRNGWAKDDEDYQGGALLFVGEQDIGRFVKFWFAIGPGVVNSEGAVADELGFNFRLGSGPVWLGVSYNEWGWQKDGELEAIVGGALTLNFKL